jgi:hypothetical protein
MMTKRAATWNRSNREENQPFTLETISDVMAKVWDDRRFKQVHEILVFLAILL